MENIRFYQEDTGRWYVDLPGWEGEKEELMMVSGADTLLSIISEKRPVVELEVSLVKKDGYLELKRLEEDILMGGAYYWSDEFKMEIWLCEVLKWVYGILPKEIFFRKK